MRHRINDCIRRISNGARYQPADYTWKVDPNQAITRVEVRIGEQKVYVYQGDVLAGESPTTTGKPGYETPTGHYTVLVKDIDHKSNLYGVFTRLPWMCCRKQCQCRAKATVRHRLRCGGHALLHAHPR